MKKMEELEQIDISNKRVIIRVDYNVPINNEIILDDFRINSSIPTIKYCIDRGASIVLMSHLGRPNGIEPELSLDPIAFRLEEILERDVLFSSNCISDEAVSLSQQMNSGEIHLLENLRFHNGEIINDKVFSWHLAQHANIYINDAFGTAHRAHASNVGIIEHMKFSAAGLLIKKEIKYLHDIINTCKGRTVFLLGGKKIDDKINIINYMMDKVNTILIGGAMAYPFLSAKGMNIGRFPMDSGNIYKAKSILESSKVNNVNIILPNDVVSSKNINDLSSVNIKNINDLSVDEIGYDIGPETTLKFEQAISKADTILWNGTLGVCEQPFFSTGTQSIISTIKKRTSEGLISIICGGDTAAVLNEKDSNNFTHISTGGGASLQLLSGNKLPAFDALCLYDEK